MLLQYSSRALSRINELFLDCHGCPQNHNLFQSLPTFLGSANQTSKRRLDYTYQYRVWSLRSLVTAGHSLVKRRRFRFIRLVYLKRRSLLSKTTYIAVCI